MGEGGGEREGGKSGGVEDVMFQSVFGSSSLLSFQRSIVLGVF